jgi:hypothetical protein
VASFGVRVMVALTRWLGRLEDLLDVDKKPFQSIGYVAMLIVTGIFVIALPFAAKG